MSATFNSLYLVRDRGKLHIGINDGYSGSINSYNNFFTRLIAWTFGWSVQITANGRAYHVDKESYTDWLEQATGQHSGQTKNLNLNLHALSFLKPNQGLMRQYLSEAKTTRLYYKLVEALTDGDFERAKLYAGKGAEVNGSFWYREQFGISYTTLKDNLPESPLDIQAQHVSPLLFAAGRQNSDLCQFLCRLGADQRATGQKVHFRRIIENVQTSTSLDPSFGTRCGPRGQHMNDFRLDMHTQTTTYFLDEFQQEAQLSFNSDSDTYSLVTTAVSSKPVQERFDRLQQATTTPVVQFSVMQRPHRPYYNKRRWHVI